MFWFVPYISDPVWNFTYVAYSLTSTKPAKNTKGRICTICRCCYKVATYKWEVHNGKIEIISFASFVLNRPLLYIFRCRSRYETELVVSGDTLFQVQGDIIWST